MKFEKNILLEAEDDNSVTEVEDSPLEAENNNEDYDWYSYLDDITNGRYELDMENLTDALDWIKITNQENLEDGDYYQPINLLVIGEPGGGKTSIIKQWAKSRDIALKALTGSELTDTMVQGLPFADTEVDPDSGKETRKQKFLPSTVFDALDDKKGRFSVLFLDELNRSWPEAEAAILSLIQDHEISDINSEEEKKHFDKFLFTVAACNPPSTNKETRNLSLALNTRFRFFNWDSDPRTTRDFWNKEYDNRLNKIKNDFDSDKDQAKYDRKFKKYSGRKEIINALVDSGRFVFSDTQENGEASKNGELVLNSRTLASALEACDGTVGQEVGIDRRGNPKYTPGSFLGEFAYHCGSKFLELIDEILAPVAEAQNEANGFQATVMDKFYRWEKAAKRAGKI